ncbi:MAG: A/G-specific adenine glycosylase [Acidobacteriota bacterium]
MSRFWSLPEASLQSPAGIDPGRFRRALLAWFATARRPLPWRQNTDFYRVWISEIMLQQTRVEAVIPYYTRFLERFPTVTALAAAAEQEVLAAWSGLGYYSRARKLHEAARQMAARGFPTTHQELGALAGVGPYTAAALASIALGLPHAAVDGNVLRVISRLTNDASEMTAPATRRRFHEVAGELLDPASPGDFNQAMMELGATICKPGVPACAACPVETSCAARAAGTERELPVRLKKPKARDLPLHLMVFRREAEVYLVQREAGESRLAGFWELPQKGLFPRLRGRLAAEFSHQIVNDRFRVRVWVSERAPGLPEGRWVPVGGFDGIPLTTISRKALAALS